MRIYGTGIVTIEGLAEINQAANDASHTAWGAFAPAAQNLERGIALARSAAIQAREAKTWEEYVAAQRIAQRAITELQRAVLKGEIVELQAARASVSLGDPGLFSRLTSIAKTVARAVVNVVKIPVRAVTDVVNRMVMKVAEMTGLARRVIAERNATMALMQELRALAPRVTDPKLREDITELEREVAILDAETARRLQETNEQIQQANEDTAEAENTVRGGVVEGAGIGNVLLIAAGVAALITIWTGLLTLWSKWKGETAARIEEAKGDIALTEAEQARLEQNEQIREVATEESERLREEAEALRQEAETAYGEGNTEEANALLREAGNKEEQAIQILQPHLTPIEPLTLPSAVAPTVKEEEKKGLFEQWTGIKPAWISGAAMLVFIALLLPQIIGIVKSVMPKSKE